MEYLYEIFLWNISGEYLGKNYKKKIEISIGTE